MSEETEKAFAAMGDAIAVVMGRLTASDLMQNAIATYLKQKDPAAAEEISRLFQAQYDALPSELSGPMNEGFQKRLADIRQALGLPGNLPKKPN